MCNVVPYVLYRAPRLRFLELYLGGGWAAIIEREVFEGLYVVELYDDYMIIH